MFFFISKKIYIKKNLMKTKGQPKSIERDTNKEKSKRENKNTNGANKN